MQLITAPTAPSQTIYAETVCPRCRSTKFVLKSKGPHVGLYCQSGHWVKWLSPAHENRDPAAPAQRPPQERCQHCSQLDAHLKTLDAIERHLIIITRALLNGGAR